MEPKWRLRSTTFDRKGLKREERDRKTYNMKIKKRIRPEIKREREREKIQTQTDIKRYTFVETLQFHFEKENVFFSLLLLFFFFFVLFVSSLQKRLPHNYIHAIRNGLVT